MSKKTFQFVLSASTRGWQTFNKAQQGLASFNREVKSGNKLMASAKGQVAQLVGAYLGFDALRNTARIITDANTAAYNLESSLVAANREFNNVGSLEGWGEAITRLSGKLKIYSRADLQTATARTVDMTKRLGLSSTQMEVLIERTGDLSAGKFKLEDGIERVTAALRGEAEASEALGLTLNETYVKTWYEASDAYDKAWKDLTDLEKAQIRFKVFLEQALPVQGKAANSINTLAGAYGLVRAQVQNAIVENKDMVAVTKDLAKYLADNADELSEFATMIARGAANTAKFVVEYRELIAWAGKAGIALLLVGKIVGSLMTTFRGVNAAMLAMTGSTFIPWLLRARTALAALAATVGGILGTLLALKVAAVYAALSIAKLIADYHELNRLEAENNAIRIENAKAYKKLAERFREINEATGLTITSMKELDKAVADGLIHFDNATGDWVKGAGTMADAVKKSAEEQKNVTTMSLDEMRKKYKEFVDEVKRLTAEIDGRKSSLAEQLREMNRSGMSDLSAWRDLKKEAKEYEAAAAKALKTGDFDTAVKLADKAKEMYAQLNTEVRAGDKLLVSQTTALKTAMSGVQSSGALAVKALEAQKKAAQESADQLNRDSGWKLAQKAVEEVTAATDKYATIAVPRTGKAWTLVWDNAEKEGKAMIKEIDYAMTKMVNKPRSFNFSTTEAHAAGGVAGWSRLRGKLPGFGGGDRIRALLEAGEIIINKHAVKKYGASWFLSHNAMRMPVRAQHGGQVISQALAPFRMQPTAAGASGAMDTMRLELGFIDTGKEARFTGSKRDIQVFYQSMKRFGRRLS